MDSTKSFVVQRNSPFLDRETDCNPYLTQDGYDQGQIMRCDMHDVAMIPVYIHNNKEYQSYEVTLKEFQEMVKIHKTEFGESLDE